MAASTYPTTVMPSSAGVAVDAEGAYTVAVNATDIGTGARTALLSIAAAELDVPTSAVRILIGDTDLPKAPIAGGSAGTASWGWAVVKAARELLATLESEHGGQVPADGLEVTASTHADIKAQRDLSRHAFGAQFAEAWVDVDTGEVRVPRMVGVFAAGRIANAVTARSQLLGGMTWGLSMALHEQSIQDLKFGDFANRDLATYHMSANADVCDIEVEWLQEDDPQIGAAVPTIPISPIPFVPAAAIGNAVYNATGVRLRETPMTLDRIIGQL
jgi:xanthine dehydrogenase YagR molybdenum-binding subunit